jgi:hypothetical protein
VLAVRHHQREQEVVPVLQYGVPEDVAEDRTSLNLFTEKVLPALA